MWRSRGVVDFRMQRQRPQGGHVLKETAYVLRWQGNGGHPTSEACVVVGGAQHIFIVRHVKGPVSVGADAGLYACTFARGRMAAARRCAAGCPSGMVKQMSWSIAASSLLRSNTR